MITRKIKFYEVRTFSEKFSDTFDFINQNSKVLMKYLFYSMMPFAVISGFGLGFVGDMYSQLFGNINNPDAFIQSIDANPMYNLGIGLTALPGYVSYLILYTMVFSLIQLYNDREEGLEGVVFKDIRPYFDRNISKLLIYGLVTVATFIGISLLCLFFGVLISGFLLIPLLFGIFIFLVCGRLILPAYIFSGESITSSYSKGLSYGWNTFWGMLGMGIVITFLSYVLMILFAIPFEIVIGVKAFLLSSDAEMSTLATVGYYIFGFFMGIMTTLGMYFVIVISLVALSYQYGHTAESLDSVSIEDDVENFEEKGNISDEEKVAEEIKKVKVYAKEKEDPYRYMPKSSSSEIDNFDNL